jgi:hypothetical protein
MNDWIETLENSLQMAAHSFTYPQTPDIAGTVRKQVEGLRSPLHQRFRLTSMR